MKKERIILILIAVIITLLMSIFMCYGSSKRMSYTAAYHMAVQDRLEKVLINIDKSYNDSITAIKNQEYNRLCK